MKSEQHGFGIIVVLLIIVVVGVLGFSGWYVWQIQQRQSTSQQAQKTTTDVSDPSKTVQMLSVSMDQTVGKAVSFSYPETWQLDKGEAQKSPYFYQIFTLTSPSGKVKVVYETSDGGLGGACFAEEQGTLSTFSTTDVPGVLAAKYVETTFTDGMMSGNMGFAGLMRASQLTGVAVGKSYCDIYLAENIPLYENSDSSARLTANIVFTDSSIQKDPVKFAAALSGDEYEQAKLIILSTVMK